MGCIFCQDRIIGGFEPVGDKTADLLFVEIRHFHVGKALEKIFIGGDAAGNHQFALVILIAQVGDPKCAIIFLKNYSSFLVNLFPRIFLKIMFYHLT